MGTSYTRETAGMLFGLVALQQVWGVDFEPAVARAHDVIQRFGARTRGKAVVLTLDDMVELMKSVAPPPS